MNYRKLQLHHHLHLLFSGERHVGPIQMGGLREFGQTDDTSASSFSLRFEVSIKLYFLNVFFKLYLKVGKNPLFIGVLRNYRG